MRGHKPPEGRHGECPRLARGMVTLAATRRAASHAQENAHGLPVGSLRSSLESGVAQATNVKLPRASRGHLKRDRGAGEVAASVRLPRASRGHPNRCGTTDRGWPVRAGRRWNAIDRNL